MNRFKCLISAPVRLFAAMPLIFGLTAMVAAPTAQAVTVTGVDIDNGEIDVNQDGFIFEDDNLNNVIVWCAGAPVRVDIIEGRVDITELNGVNTNDDLLDCDLNDESSRGGEQVPTRNRVDFRDGFVDVDEDTRIAESNGNDDAPNVQLFVLP